MTEYLLQLHLTSQSVKTQGMFGRFQNARHEHRCCQDNPMCGIHQRSCPQHCNDDPGCHRYWPCVNPEGAVKVDLGDCEHYWCNEPGDAKHSMCLSKPRENITASCQASSNWHVVDWHDNKNTFLPFIFAKKQVLFRHKGSKEGFPTKIDSPTRDMVSSSVTKHRIAHSYPTNIIARQKAMWPKIACWFQICIQNLV